ncbi:MAG: Clp protease N-terminal domain-containing protein, partial [Saccharofermentanales bacterium]
MVVRFSERTGMVMKNAYEAAKKSGLDYVGTEHLLYGILSEGENLAYELLAAGGLTVDAMKDALNQVSAKKMNENETVDEITDIAKMIEMFTPRTKRVLEIAALAARNAAQTAVEPEHLLIAVIRENENMAQKIMTAAGMDVRRIYSELMAALMATGNENGSGAESGEDIGEEESDENSNSDFEDINQNLRNFAQSHGVGGDKAGAAGKEKGKGKTPNLDKYGRDLTKAAANGEFDPIIGREQEIERVMQILCRRTKNNPVLIGEPGVGKTAIAEGLAQKIAHGEAPEMLKNKKIISLDLSGMIAGAKYRGEFEERLKNSLTEAINSQDTIVFLDELHTVIGAGGAEGAMDAANILKPVLTRGQLQIIGATTTDEYRKHVEKDAAFARRFQPVTVGEPSNDEAVLILKGIRDKYEVHHNVKITDEVIEEAVKLSVRYITDRYLPDKGIDLIDEAASRHRMNSFTEPESFKDLERKIEELNSQKKSAVEKEDFEAAAKLREETARVTAEFDAEREKWRHLQDTESNILTTDEIASIVASWTGIPVKKLTETDSDKLRNLEDEIHKRVIGQDEAVRSVAKAIRRGRLGLKDPKRPTGSFIFLGTTRVGKTELAKSLAEVMLGTENALIRLYMSEYIEKFDVSK